MTAASRTPSGTPARQIALLRAINVGGHVVKMDRLRQLFSSLEEPYAVSHVQTFIASGNVIFESASRGAALERAIEAHLQAALGYPVVTFVRTANEMAAAAGHAPFKHDLDGANIYVTFLKIPLAAAARRKVMALGTDLDEFDVHAREIYWLRRNAVARQGEPFPALERLLGLAGTSRNLTTVKKMAARFCADGDA